MQPTTARLPTPLHSTPQPAPFDPNSMSFPPPLRGAIPSIEYWNLRGHRQHPYRRYYSFAAINAYELVEYPVNVTSTQEPAVQPAVDDSSAQQDLVDAIEEIPVEQTGVASGTHDATAIPLDLNGESSVVLEARGIGPGVGGAEAIEIVETVSGMEKKWWE